MDLNSILDMAATRGPVFWAAAGAVALGAAFLAAALVQILRGLDLRRRRPTAAPDEAAAPPAAASPDTTPDVYVPTPAVRAATVASAAKTAVSGESSLALMLRRLQSAGDRLEEIAADLGIERELSCESGLKEDGQEVEYVFKACGP